MKKIASLMLLLLSPICTRAMDAQPETGSKAETPLSPRTRCLTKCGAPLIEMVRHEMSLLPDDREIADITSLINVAEKASALKALERSLVPKATGNAIERSEWRKAEDLLSATTKEYFLRQIINEARESAKLQ